MKELKCSKDMFTRWRWREGDDLNDMSCIEGRPRKKTKNTPTLHKKILSYSENKQNRSLRKTTKHLVTKGIHVSQSTVHKVLKEEGLYPYIHQVEPKITPKQLKDRVKFARDHKDFKWKSVLFTDEKDFPLFSKPNPKNDVVWAKKGSKIPRSNRK